MKAYQIMEAILEELDKRTKNEKGEEATRKRSDHGASYRDYIHHKELYPHNQGITGNEEKDLKREAKKLYQAIDHYDTYNKEHGYNPHPGPYINQLKGDFEKVRNTLRHINNYKRYSKASEALDIMEEILLEASPLEVKRRIANKFKDKIGDMYNKAVEDDKKNSEEKTNLHNKIHGEGGNTVVVMGDKIENFSDNPEIRKDQEKFNEVTDKSKKSGEKVHKLGNLKNLVDYYKNEALELAEAIKDEIRNHKKWTGGTSTFSYKGNDYSYNPEKGLKKEGQTKDDRNPIQKVVDSSNKEFEKARKYNYDTERQSRAVGKKINKEVAKLEKKEGKGAFPAKTNDTIKKLLDTASVIQANKADADKNFQEINKRQQDMAGSAKGVKHQMYDIWTSKKEDNFGWKPTVKTSEALELTEAIINEFTEADKKEAAKKVLPERKREYLSKYADVLDTADEVGSENVPQGNMKDLERAEKRYKHAEKVANEALSLAESIIGYADNIFELDYENKQNVNTNKIRKLKKDKDGENVEVVSVADELFPYEGNAKQQFNQKVLAKINDMIEGKGSLEDLIQFVRKYSGNRKAANESTEISEAVKLLEEMINKTVEKYTDDDGNVHELEFGSSSKKDNVNTKYQFRHRINGKPVVSASDSEPNANYERKHAIKNYNLKKANESLEEIKQVVEGLFVNDGRGDLLQDVDRATGSHGQKAINKGVATITGTKEAKIAKVKTPSPEIKNKQIGMNVHKDKSLMPKPTLKNMYKQAEG